MLQLQETGAVYRIRRERHMVFPAQDVVDLSRNRAARTAFEEHFETICIHPTDRLLQTHRRHPLLGCRVARLACFRRQWFRGAATVHGDARTVIHPVPRELAELR